jgi:spore germination protein D
MRYGVSVLLLSMFCLVVTGCGQNGTAGEEMDYEKTKKMVVDIFKTDEGKKAIQDVLSDEAVKSELVIKQDEVSKAVETTITSDKGKKFWEEAFKDPEFAAAYAKSLRSEHEQLLKDLTKDPDYRKMLMDIMKEPELQTELKDLLNSQEIRDIYKDTLIETMDSPLVKTKIQDILLKAAAEMKPKEQSGGGGG